MHMIHNHEKKKQLIPIWDLGTVNMNDITMNKLNFLSRCPKVPRKASSLEAFCWVGVQFSALCRSKHGCSRKSRQCFHLSNMSHAIVPDLLTSRQYNFFCNEAKPSVKQRKKIKAMPLAEAGALVTKASAAAGCVCTGGTWEKTKHRSRFLWSVCV